MMLAHGQQKQGSCCSSGGRRDAPDDESNKKIRVEFAVNMNNQNDLNKVDEVLKSKGFSLVLSDTEDKIIQVDLSRHHKKGEASASQLAENAHSLQRFIEEQTGLLTVVKGIGEHSSAVAELRPSPDALSRSRSRMLGVVRMSQIDNSQCYVDGSIDGLTELGSGDRYSLAIHEFGDLSGDRYENIGDSMIHIDETNTTSSNGKQLSVINKTLPNCDVASMIGRSVALTEISADDTYGENTMKRIISAGVIARASTIGANKKKICSCSGRTLWEERLDKKQMTS